MIYVFTNAGGHGKLVAVRPNGTVLWVYSIQYGLVGSPAIGPDDTIYAGTSNGELIAVGTRSTITLHTGLGRFIKITRLGPTLKWTLSLGVLYDRVYPAIGPDGVIYAGATNKHVFAVNTNGTIKWTFSNLNGEVVSAPAFGPTGTIYVGAVDGRLYAIKPDGTKKWTFKAKLGIAATPAVAADGTIYVGSYDHYLYAIHPSGIGAWQYETGKSIESSPVVDNMNHILYVASTDGIMYALTAPGN
ncbi:PQQ-binding-like beta-propeller repeat protein [Paenibacillus lignilyticus]|uniref:PQQ-like beta-propeller repeat protein n=1 Tax=Paenibacillus lignilyticus TaxID=1172615 RepID=A0ABS5CCW3_9BACL|nr:PQQ-binding-like beta-propeller repeat protein [Paenibacillus lignilyticus]MBP3963820.1 PQQ-like beta-propeller repeat protein [Paenibacillus lignilyticus]